MQEPFLKPHELSFKNHLLDNRQVGGQHYKTMPIQPIDFILANELGWCEGNAVKYICRYKQKNGVEDLKKAIHYLEILVNRLETNV